jgi:hypothetical protein
MDGEHVFLLFLTRFQYPDKLYKMEQRWGREYSVLSRVISTMLGFLEENHFHLILDNLDFYLNRFEYYNQKVIDKINETYGEYRMELADVCCI